MIMSAAPPATLTWEGVTARRMARHALAEPVTELGLAGIAGVLCGAHAQVLSAAELSIGRRIAGATRADVQRALWQDRMLVKTFGPRGAGLEQVHLDGKPAWIVARRYRDAAARAAPRPAAAALLRRLRRGRSAPAPAVPGPGRSPRPYPGGPGRKLPGAAYRRRGRRRLVPAPLRPQAHHHRRAAARAHRRTASPAQIGR